MGEANMLSYEQACELLKQARIKRGRYDRLRQRDNLQNSLAPLLDVQYRDKFVRQLNDHFRL